MTHRSLARGELVAIHYRSRFLRVPFERAVADHRELMAERRTPPAIVWSGTMKDLSDVMGRDADDAAIEDAR